MTLSSILGEGVISKALDAFTAFCTWKAQEAKNNSAAVQYNLTRQIEKDIETDEAEITRLRDLGDAASQLAADQLRQRIERAQGVAAVVSTPCAASVGGTTDPDQGRPVQSS